MLSKPMLQTHRPGCGQVCCWGGRHLHHAGDVQDWECVRAARGQLAALHVLQHHRVACRPSMHLPVGLKCTRQRCLY